MELAVEEVVEQAAGVEKEALAVAAAVVVEKEVDCVGRV